MTDPTARALIQRLADALAAHHQLPGRVPVFTEARAYLAAPDEPAVPTDEELLSVEDLRNAWNEQADQFNSWDDLGIDEIVWWAQRQALARYGNHIPEPISFSERYPNLRPDGDDFSKDGYLWWYEPRLKWRWAMEDAIDYIPYPTHWLPHWALPVPEQEVSQ